MGINFVYVFMQQFLLLYVISCGLVFASYWRLFEKAGIQGWKILIPVYANLLFLDILDRPRYEFFFLFIPIVNMVYVFIWLLTLARKFGKGGGIVALFIFLPFIGYPRLAFGKTEYLGNLNGNDKQPVPPYSPNLILIWFNLSLLALALIMIMGKMGFNSLDFDETTVSSFFVFIPFSLGLVMIARSGQFDFGLIVALSVFSWLVGILGSVFHVPTGLGFILAAVIIAALWYGYGKTIQRFNLPSLPVGAVLLVVYIAALYILPYQLKFFNLDTSFRTMELSNSFVSTVLIGAVAFCIVHLYKRRTFTIPITYAAAAVVSSLVSVIFGLQVGMCYLAYGNNIMVLFLLIILCSGVLVPGNKPSFANGIIAAVLAGVVKFESSMTGMLDFQLHVRFILPIIALLVLNYLISEKRGKDLVKALRF